MAVERQSLPLRVVSAVFRRLARAYIRSKQPLLIAVAGSVGKTTTKLVLADVLRTEKRVSCMDDSYNAGIGLYLSVFELKVPTSINSPLAWLSHGARAFGKFLHRGPEILILEYGIDKPGDMDELLSFARPDIAILTAATPEHMEFLKNIETVSIEETKVLRGAKEWAVVNAQDVGGEYLKDVATELYRYGGKKPDADYTVTAWTKTGATVDFTIDDLHLKDVSVRFISEPLIRQLTGAGLLAHKLGYKGSSIRKGLERAQPAASRMRVFEGLDGATIIDDTTNFSPIAGIEAIRALKRMPTKRHIAILGNMHELGDFAEQGFAEVAAEFKGLDQLILVGELSHEYFGRHAQDMGFTLGKNLFKFDDSPSAGIFLRDQLTGDDAVLVKGPFGRLYLEEAVKKLLRDPKDAQYLGRQSDFWQCKKRAQFGDLLDK